MVGNYGEVFQDFGYAHVANREPKLIYAKMTVRSGEDNEDCVHNTMSYIDEYKSDYDSDFHPANIYFDVRIPPHTFRELAENTKSGLLPSEIRVGFEGPPFCTVRDEPPKIHPLEYGWKPDGSGKIWHNKEHRRVAIESISFHYVMAKARHDEEHPERPLAWDEPRRDAAAQPPKREKYGVTNFLFSLGIGLMGFGMAEWFFPQWYSNGQLSAGEDHIFALVLFIGGAILVSLNGIKPQT